MFGKHFASMYSGSMFGKPAMVFAVWGYVIAFMRPSRKDGHCYVELNPSLLAATFNGSPDEVLEAIRSLASPDPGSRSKEADGRRLLPLADEFVPGPMQFLVVNGAKYRAMRDEEERRTYLREAKRKERASTKSLTVNRCQPSSSQAEAEAEAEAENEERIAAPAAPPPSAAVVPLKRPAVPSWSREACDDWIAAYRGTAPGGRIGKALAPLVKEHGWEAVRIAWRSYLAQTEAEYASPQRFAATFGRWSGAAPAAAARSVADKTRVNLESWIAGKEQAR